MMEVKRRTVESLVKRLTSISEQTQTETICELRLMTRNDPETRSLLVEAGALPILTETLFSPSPTLQENSISTLLNISISHRDLLISTPNLFDALSHLLRLPSATQPSLQNACATLYSLLINEDNRPIIGAKRDIVFALVNIIRNPKSPPRSIKDALKALFGISLYPPNRTEIVGLGAVSALFTLVVKDGRVGIVEDATAVIAQIAGCEDSCDEFMKVSGIRVLVDLLDSGTGSSDRARENAVSALLNLIESGGEKIVGEVREMGFSALDGIVSVAENGSSKGKSRAMALLNIFNEGRGEFQKLDKSI